MDLQIIDVGLHGNGFPLAGFDSNVKDSNAVFFVDFLWKVAWGKVMPLVLLPAPLPQGLPVFSMKTLGHKKKTTTMGGFRGFGSKLASECVCAPQFFSFSASTFCGEKMDMK